MVAIGYMSIALLTYGLIFLIVSIREHNDKHRDWYDYHNKYTNPKN